ncbi:MAG: TatD family hydrolase [Microthrixaceae bacterium]
MSEPAAPSHQWIDNHCHLGYEGGGRSHAPAPTMLAEARTAGVVGFVDVAVDLSSARECLGRSLAHGDVWATAGVHPHEAADGIGGLEELLAQHADTPELVAVGECGLDYHYDNSPRADQRRVFAEQIALAHRFDLACVIHSRDAWDDTFAVLDSEGVPPRTVFHCFTGGPSEAAQALQRGAFVSVSGIVTFPSATELVEAVREVPLERLMVETDTPYLTPVPHRGEPNRPALVALVGAGVAEVKGLSVAEVSRTTVANTRSFYRLGDGHEGDRGARS